MEEDDRYASIFGVCNPRRSSEAEALELTHDADNFVPLPPPPPPQPQTLPECRFIDHFPEIYGAIIPPQSLEDYLCPLSPQQPHQDYLERHHHTPDCILSCQISSPPPPVLDSPLASPDRLQKIDENGVDNLIIKEDTQGLWLSQLKCMARQDRLLLFDDVVWLVNKFRASQFRLSWCPSRSLKMVLCSSSSSSSSSKSSSKVLSSLSATEAQTQALSKKFKPLPTEPTACWWFGGIGGNTLNVRVTLTESNVGGLKSDDDDNAAASSSGKVFAQELAGNGAAIQHRCAYCTSEAAINAVTSGGMECGSLYSEGDFIGMASYAVELIAHKKPSG